MEWSGYNTEAINSSPEEAVEDASTTDNSDIQPSDTSAKTDPGEIQDGFLLINGGTFLMGSPDTENWRIDDEVQHEVTVSSFYIDPFETTQEEYI